MSIRILLIDDYPLTLAGIRNVLSSQADFQVVGETGLGEQVLAMVKTLHPDILVLDLKLLDRSGYAVALQMRRSALHVRIVVLSGWDDVAHVAEALRLGVLGYVSKKSVHAELIQAIRLAAAGERFLSPSISLQELHEYQEMVGAINPDPLDSLTNREWEILGYVCNGKKSGQIAADLGISERTVEDHRHNILKKLKMHTVTELTLFANQRGLVFRD